MNTSKYPSLSARRCSSVCSSVMATKRDAQSFTPAASTRRRAAAAIALGSMVVPDLLATMKRDVAGLSRTSRTATGSVESSMRNRGPTSSRPKSRWKTSGARLEPPMPNSTMSVNAPARTRCAKASTWETSRWTNSTAPSQPRRFAMAVFTA